MTCCASFHEVEGQFGEWSVRRCKEFWEFFASSNELPVLPLEGFIRRGMYGRSSLRGSGLPTQRICVSGGLENELMNPVGEMVAEAKRYAAGANYHRELSPRGDHLRERMG